MAQYKAAAQISNITVNIRQDGRKVNWLRNIYSAKFMKVLSEPRPMWNGPAEQNDMLKP